MRDVLKRVRNAASKPVQAAYYRFLFGRDNALERYFGSWVRAFEDRSGRGDVPLRQETWESQYRVGVWDYLADASEQPRYQVITDYLVAHGSGGSVLDVGCGEGLLRRHLAPFGYSRYVGVDLSETAVERLRAESAPGAEAVLADAAAYEPDGLFDAIVFNECLYYFDDPLAVVRRYLAHLAPDGVVVASMFRSRRTQAIGRLLAERLSVVSETRVANRRGEWAIAVLSPRRPAA
jgi:SAM-dependent methyltransferase